LDYGISIQQNVLFLVSLSLLLITYDSDWWHMYDQWSHIYKYTILLIDYHIFFFLHSLTFRHSRKASARSLSNSLSPAEKTRAIPTMSLRCSQKSARPRVYAKSWSEHWYLV
jgi:hypothetical protein